MEPAALTTPARPPRAPGLGLAASFQVLGAFRADPLGFLLRMRRDHGDVVRFQVGPMRGYLLSHPEAVRRVLVDNSPSYTKHTRDYQKLSLSLGNGLVTSEGEFWRKQRRTIQPAFHREQIARFAETMTHKTLAMLDGWRDSGALERPVDLAHEMMALTLKIVSSTLFSLELDARVDEIGEAVSIANRQTMARMISLVDLPLWVPTARNLELRRAMRSFDGVIRTQLAARQAAGDPGDDLLGMLLTAEDPETGRGMSDAQLRDELVTMFVAGHETTANALAWCFYLLSTHPEVDRRARAEVEAALGGRPPTMADLPRLGYLKQVIQETLRLYPPVWGIGRLAVEDDVIGGYHIERGADVTLSPFVTHRHPELWQNPEGFDPDRFAQPDRIDRFTYFPFSTGQRQCIGNAFAMMEAQLILACVLSRHRVELVPGHPVTPEPLVTLRPKHGVVVRLRPA